MSDRFPLILNTSTNQIQEIASGDTLDLTGNNIKGVGIITAASVVADLTGVVTGNVVGNATGLTGIPSINVTNITGVGATFSGAVDLNSDLDVDGHTNLDNVSISGVVTATTFSGNATSADTIDITNSSSSATTFFLTFVDNNGSGKTLNLDSGLTYVPATNVLTAGTFSGSGASLTGITNANISNSAAIALSKLATGALPAGITVSGSNITAGAIYDSDVNASANIAGTKISPNFGSQNIVSTGYVSVKDLYLTDDNPTVYFTDSNNTDYIIEVNSGYWKVRDTTNSVDRLVINSDGHVDIAGNLDCAAGIDVTGNATVSGNLSVGGVLTYEDVTNVDSVGIVTARNGIKVLAGGANVVGVVTATGGVFVPDNNQIQLGNAAGSADLRIYHQSSNNHSYISETGSGSLIVLADDFYVQDTSTNTMISAKEGAEVNLHHNTALKLSTTSTGANVTSANDAVLQVTTSGTASTDDARIELITQESSFIIQNDRSLGTDGALTIGDGTKTYFQASKDGSVELYENGNKVLETNSLGVTIGDNVGLTINGGTGNRTGDAVLYVDKTNNNDWCAKFKTNVGSSNDYGLRIECNNNASYPLVVNDGSSNQFRVNGNGDVFANEFHGDGSNLTGISVGITTEQVTPSSNVATLNLAKDDHKIVASGTYTIDVSGGTEAGTHTLRIENSGTANVGFSTYFMFPSGGTPSLPTASGAISLVSFQVHKVGSVGVATVLLAGASVNFS